MEITNIKEIESNLWAMANKLRGNLDSSEYKHVVLGLIFLKYVSDTFQEKYDEIKSLGDDPEDRDEYEAENIFFVPEEARWENFVSNAKSAKIGMIIDDAMIKIEQENPTLRGVLPKNYARDELDKVKLGELIDLFTFKIGGKFGEEQDLLGRIYEYFLGKFALAEGQNSGSFYTPGCLVKLLVDMLEPFKGRVYDPCCGSGGMFVQSARFIEEHAGRKDAIHIYGQEFTGTTWKLAKMNLALRGLDGNLGFRDADTFSNDQHKNLKADFILANPPFNMKDYSLNIEDLRWKYGIPPRSNANYAWIQHIVSKLAPKGKAGFLLATKSLASELQAEKTIRENIIKENLVECIVLLPGKLFYSTPAPVSLWILNKNKKSKSTLFIDATQGYEDIDRTHRELSAKNISDICNLYHSWSKNEDTYKDQAGYCKVVDNDEIATKNYSLYPGDYVGIKIDENDFKDRMTAISNVNSDFSSVEQLMIEFTNNTNEVKNLVFQRLNNNNIPMMKVKLRDILVESSEVLGDRPEPEILSCTENAGLVLQSERFSKRVATENTSNYKVVRKTDIVYNPYLLWAGAIDQCLVVDEGITSPAYTVLRIKDDIDPLIVGHILKSNLMKKWYWNISIGTHERRRTAPVEKFLDLEVDIPVYSEQRMIINLHENMMKQLQNIKEIQDILSNTSKALNEYFTGL